MNLIRLFKGENSLYNVFKIIKNHSLIYTALFTCLFISSTAWSQVEVEHNEHTPHHFSVFTGGTTIIDEDLTDLTIGGDYEYRVNRLVGVGMVLEHAFGEIDATTILGVTDLHIWKGFVIQLGAGVEFINQKEFLVGRIGALYEFELENGFTFAPQVHYDISHEDSLVFGASFGVSF